MSWKSFVVFRKVFRHPDILILPQVLRRKEFPSEFNLRNAFRFVALRQEVRFSWMSFRCVCLRLHCPNPERIQRKPKPTFSCACRTLLTLTR